MNVNLSPEELRAVVAIRLQRIQEKMPEFAPSFFAKMGQPEVLMQRASHHVESALPAVLKEWATADATDEEVAKAWAVIQCGET